MYQTAAALAMEGRKTPLFCFSFFSGFVRPQRLLPGAPSIAAPIHPLTKSDGTRQFCSVLTFYQRLGARESLGLLDEVQTAAQAAQDKGTMPQGFDTGVFVAQLQNALAPPRSSGGSVIGSAGNGSNGSGGSGGVALFSLRCLTLVSSFLCSLRRVSASAF